MQPVRYRDKGVFALKKAASEVLEKQRTSASQEEYRYLYLPKEKKISFSKQ